MSGAKGGEDAVGRNDPADRRPILEMRNISKTFHTVKALKDVSLSVHAGELHALMGENGAGKSTLIKVLSGAYPPDAGGEILIDGAPVVTGDPIAARANGVAVIYQELSLAPNLTVSENIFLGNEPSRLRRSGSRPDARNAAARSWRSLAFRSPARTRVSSPVARRAANGRDRASARDQRAHHRHGRADDLADLARDREAVRGDRRAEGARNRDHLHQPPHGGGLPARRSRHASCATRLCRYARALGAQRVASGVDDGRPRPLWLLQEGSRPPTSKKAVALSVRNMSGGASA